MEQPPQDDDDDHHHQSTTTTRMSTAVRNRRPIGLALSTFGRLAALQARRQIVEERGSRKRGRAGLAGGRRRRKHDERVRLNAGVLDANTLSAHRRGEGVVHKQDGGITGRLGEAAVYKYFVEQLGSGNVRWMNEGVESGLPYDITIKKGVVTEYVEVKATFIPKKIWFHITRRELQFAAEKEDLLTIAYVLLSKPDKASIVFLNNPHKLRRQRDLKLALVMSMRCEELVGEYTEQISFSCTEA